MMQRHQNVLMAHHTLLIHYVAPINIQDKVQLEWILLLSMMWPTSPTIKGQTSERDRE